MAKAHVGDPDVPDSDPAGEQVGETAEAEPHSLATVAVMESSVWMDQRKVKGTFGEVEVVLVARVRYLGGTQMELVLG